MNADQLLKALKERYAGLPPELRRAAQFVLDHPNEVGVSSLRKVAVGAKVKPNTLVRLARTLGFENYEDFRHPVRELLRRGVDSFPDRARWLQSLAQDDDTGDLYSKMAETSLANLEQLFSKTTTETVKSVADLISASRTTYVYGVGMCYPAAFNFWYVGQMAFENLRLIPREGALAVDELVRCGKRDILLAMTFKPYRREIVDAARIARKRGSTIVSITDSRASPIALLASHVFVAPTATPQIYPSALAVIALLETITAFMVARAGKEAVGRIETFHRARAEAGVYVPEKT